MEVRDFRPLSLVESVYKILAKVLAIKMKQMLVHSYRIVIMFL